MPPAPIAERNLAEAAAEYSSRLVHVSTDMVLDGSHAPYSDDAGLINIG